MINSIENNALSAVPMMEELSDDKLREMMGGMMPGWGNWFTATCECGCSICTSWLYACTS